MLASESSCAAAVQVLVQRGADLRAADSLGHDVLHYAKLSGSAEVRNVLNSVLQRQQADPGTTRCTTQGSPLKAEMLMLDFGTVLYDIGLYFIFLKIGFASDREIGLLLIVLSCHNNELFSLFSPSGRKWYNTHTACCFLPSQTLPSSGGCVSHRNLLFWGQL